MLEHTSRWHSIILAAICWTTVGLSIESSQDTISARRARALNRKTSACRPCRWNDESANADCNTAIEDGELSERARRTKRLKNSFLSGSKMASVDDAIHITASVSLIKFYMLVSYLQWSRSSLSSQPRLIGSHDSAIGGSSLWKAKPLWLPSPIARALVGW